MRFRIALLIFALIQTAALIAADEERLLLPVVVSGLQGAHGSEWNTEVWMHVGTDTPTFVYPLRLADILPLRNETIRLPVEVPDASTTIGEFLFVTKESIDAISMNVRLYENSSAQSGWGVSIPVVRDADFSVKTLSLFPVPTSGTYRQTLRLYSPRAEGGQVEVHITGLDDRNFVRTFAVQLGESRSIYSPSYAEVNLMASLEGAEGTVKVETTPRGDFPIWAFVSITSNVNQQVTLITPMPPKSPN